MSKYELTWVGEGKNEKELNQSSFSCYYNDVRILCISAQLRIKSNAESKKKKSEKELETMTKWRNWYVSDSIILFPNMPISGWETLEEAKKEVQELFDGFCRLIEPMFVPYKPKFPLVWEQLSDNLWRGTYSAFEGSAAMQYNPDGTYFVAINTPELLAPKIAAINASSLQMAYRLAQEAFDKVLSGETND